ncbi:MAG TPA: hypothetical protein VI893_04675 [Thermoplasmata archaeon]|nr:hypothetical protein [Thermoplasmata archaeon]
MGGAVSDPSSFIGRRVIAVVPGTSAGDIRFPAGTIIGMRDKSTMYVIRRGRKIPEETEALIFTVRLDTEFRSPLTDAPIVGLILNLRVPELVDDEIAGKTGPKDSKVLVTAITDPKLLEPSETEPDLNEKNSDHYGPGYLEPA